MMSAFQHLPGESGMHPDIRRIIVGGLAAVLACSLTASAAEPLGDLKVRRFQLSYAVSIAGLKPGDTARLWMPVPPNNDEQKVHVAEQKLPGPSQQGREKKYGNDI